jgi:RNA polymerase sigma-70 factor (ECF subfamily)
VLAHYGEDLALQEIADRLHMTESAVRSRLHRARTSLKGILGKSAALSRDDLAA